MIPTNTEVWEPPEKDMADAAFWPYHPVLSILAGLHRNHIETRAEIFYFTQKETEINVYLQDDILKIKVKRTHGRWLSV